MPLFGLDVVERTDLRQGKVYRLGSVLVVGTKPPTEVQRLIMEGVRAAHPWFRDPLRGDVVRWAVRLLWQAVVAS